ncbi:exported hypothetical protein [Syntrophobacter sp. SbD1]|nr:exported hypothetical protein [Syntrophobacter sp. SbD1]
MWVLKVTAITALVCIGLLTTTVFPVVAQDAPAPDKSGEHLKGYDDWHFSVNLGEWAPPFQGSVTAKGQTSPVDLTLYDLLKSIYVAEFAIDGRFEVSKGPWGVLIDGVYFKANQSAMAQKSINIPILDPPPFTIQGRADVTGVYSVGESALSYDVYASPCLVANMPALTVGILGGARYTYFRTVVDLEVSGSGPLGLTRTFQSDKTADWVDPFVGWRVLYRPTEKWTTSIKTEFGGFGVGSEFIFNIDVEAKYHINKCLFVNFGLDTLYTDYATGSGNDKFAYNMWNCGPFFGVGVEF